MSDSREEHLHEETSQVASFAHLQQELAMFQREIMFLQDYTDAHIDRDEETMNNLVTKAKEKAKTAKQQEFIEWTPQSSQDIPSSMDSLKQLGENYTLLEQELHEKGFATDYLVQSTEK